MSCDSVPAGQGEAEAPTGAQPDLCQTSMSRQVGIVHYAAGLRTAASSGNRSVHRALA
jgi:hypothetical protein